LVAALAKPVCEDYGVWMIGYSMPLVTNEKDEIESANVVGDGLCTNFYRVNLESIYSAAKNFSISNEYESISHMDQICLKTKIRRGNLKARVRMMFLYDKAAEFNGCVLSTDNYTEYLLGFWTLHGDVGDIAPVQCYWKTEVYEMAKWLVQNEGLTCMQKAIDIIPTDGLGVTKSDFDQLGMNSYEAIDSALKQYLKMGTTISGAERVIDRHINTEWKRNLPFNFERNGQ
jgi:NAD+ synthase